MIKTFVLSIIKIQSTRKVKYTNKRAIFFLFELQGYAMEEMTLFTPGFSLHSTYLLMCAGSVAGV